MNTYHEQELTSLICQQWDLMELMSDATMATKEREGLQQQLTRNIYQIARIIDVYQNRLIIFHFKNKSFDFYSEVVQDPRFDIMHAEVLLKQVFAFKNISTVQVIEVDGLGKSKLDLYQTFVQTLPIAV